MNRFAQLMTFALGGVLAFSMLQSLSACSDGRVSIEQVVEVFSAGMDDSAQSELRRFNDAYATYTNDPANDRFRDHFRNTFRLVRANYVVEVDDTKLIDDALKGIASLEPKPHGETPSVLVEAALDGMLAGLDPHSSYLNPDEYLQMKIDNRGEFGGLGISVTMDDKLGLIRVISPIEDTPAFKAGIEPGDLITHLDGAEVKGMTLSDGVNIMRGQPGEPIVLTILRTGKAPFDVKIVRDIIRVKSVRWRLEGNIGYLQVTSFTEQVDSKLEQASADMFAEAAQNNVTVQGVVLDLRGNPGGLLDQALYVSDAFLEDGQIVSVRERNPRNDRVYMSEPGDLTHGLPLVVLINEGSASASEIVAGALKDHGRAMIMGRRSFGKGSVQTIQPLPAEGALRLTIARYFAPSGHTIQARGVLPDIVINRPLPENGKDEREIRREEDLTDVLKGDDIADRAITATLESTSCPVVVYQDRDDPELGCALAYLHAGSAPAFLASLQPNM
jgi:carboxyl-terminal processing protease